MSAQESVSVLAAPHRHAVWEKTCWVLRTRRFLHLSENVSVCVEGLCVRAHVILISETRCMWRPSDRETGESRGPGARVSLSLSHKGNGPFGAKHWESLPTP
eukprot:6843643-Prymnesium_polylepis.1